MGGWNYKSALVFYEEGEKGGMTQQYYLDSILKQHVQPIFQQLKASGRPCILQEDDDGSHGTRTRHYIVAHWKDQEACISHYANPPQSPDFSPIENVRRVLKQRVKLRKAETKEYPRVSIQEEWKKITYEEINKYIATMPD
jgi:hypothetical protein